MRNESKQCNHNPSNHFTCSGERWAWYKNLVLLVSVTYLLQESVRPLKVLLQASKSLQEHIIMKLTSSHHCRSRANPRNQWPHKNLKYGITKMWKHFHTGIRYLSNILGLRKRQSLVVKARRKWLKRIQILLIIVRATCTTSVIRQVIQHVKAS